MNFCEKIDIDYKESSSPKKNKIVSPRSHIRTLTSYLKHTPNSSPTHVDTVESYGVVCFNIDPSLSIDNDMIKNFFYNKFINISEFNYSNIGNINLVPYFYDKIKILMIRRQHSLHYIEFLRGKYDIDNTDHIKKIFSLMSRDENIQIKNDNFDTLWCDLWKATATSKIYQKEYNSSKKKFDFLKSNNFYNLLSNERLSTFIEPEWGFPKGRLNQNEKKIDCAIRELCEETNINCSLLHVLERVNCLEEEYVGSNMVNYKHVYYLATSESELEFNISQTYEVGDIGWFTIPEALHKIRPYYEKRISLIHQLYFFIISLITEIKKNKKDIYSYTNIVHSLKHVELGTV